MWPRPRSPPSVLAAVPGDPEAYVRRRPAGTRKRRRPPAGQPARGAGWPRADLSADRRRGRVCSTYWSSRAGERRTTLVGTVKSQAPGTRCGKPWTAIRAGRSRRLAAAATLASWLTASAAPAAAGGQPVRPRGPSRPPPAAPPGCPAGCCHLRSSRPGRRGCGCAGRHRGLRGLQDARSALVVRWPPTWSGALPSRRPASRSAGSAWGTVAAQTGAAAYLAVVARGARRAGAALRPGRAGLQAAAVTGAQLVLRTLGLLAVLHRKVTGTAGRPGAAAWPRTIAGRAGTLLASRWRGSVPGRRSPGGTWARETGRGPVGRHPHDRLGSHLRHRIRGGAIRVHPRAAAYFPAAPDVRQMLVPGLVVAAFQQPIAGVVFVLDGVLIGAGGPGLAGARRPGGRSCVRRRRGGRHRRPRRPGEPVAGVHGMAAGPFHHPHAAGTRPAVAGDRRSAAVTQP